MLIEELGQKLYEAMRGVQQADHLGEDLDEEAIEAALVAWELRKVVLPRVDHKWREWANVRFGESPIWNSWTRSWEPVEPFPGACGDCGRDKETHGSD